MSKFSRPTGGRRDEMVASPAWPEIDDDALLARHEELVRMRTQLVSATDTWKRHKASLFGRDVWFGGAAAAAEENVAENIESMESLKAQLDAAIGFYAKARDTVHDAKSDITRSTNNAQETINRLDSTNEDDAAKIEDEVIRTFLSNVSRVDLAVNQLASHDDSTRLSPERSANQPIGRPHRLRFLTASRVTRIARRLRRWRGETTSGNGR